MSSRNIWSKVVPMARTSSWRHMPKTLDSSTLRWAQIWRAYSSCGSWANLANSWKESFSNWAMVWCRGDGVQAAS